MPNLKKLREAFDQGLKDIWQEWDDKSSDPMISPFMDMEEVPELEANPGFNYEVGWLQGVASAMDWPLDRPRGPKDWSPKGKHPRSSE